MAKFDYNSSSFKNAAIDKMNTRFGNGTPEKKSMTAQSASLANPFTQRTPINQPLANTSIARPTAPKPVSAGSKPETKPTTPAAKPAAPAATSTAPKTRKEVRKEVGAKVAAAKGEKRLSKIESQGSKTTEEKMALREKRAQNLGKAVRGAAELVGTAATTYLVAYNAGKKKEGN
jgi:hypothetical protein